jgi:electron transport complex protein RnfG
MRRICCWAISSEPRQARTALGVALLSLIVALGGAAAVGAKVFVTADEAVRLAFPGCEVAHRTVFLTPDQQRRARELSGEEIASRLVSSYVASRQGRPAGAAYLDTHRVRTQPETLMIAVDAQGKIMRIEVLSFREPEEYLPRGAWYQQFVGKALGPELQLKRAILPVSGATLTARATTGAVRRVLALHQVLAPIPQAP